MISDFKNEFMKNYRTLNFFGFKTALTVNKEKMSGDMPETMRNRTTGGTCSDTGVSAGKSRYPQNGYRPVKDRVQGNAYRNWENRD